MGDKVASERKESRLPFGDQPRSGWKTLVLAARLPAMRRGAVRRVSERGERGYEGALNFVADRCSTRGSYLDNANLTGRAPGHLNFVPYERRAQAVVTRASPRRPPP